MVNCNKQPRVRLGVFLGQIIFDKQHLTNRRNKRTNKRVFVCALTKPLLKKIQLLNQFSSAETPSSSTFSLSSSSLPSSSSLVSSNPFVSCSAI